MPRKNKNNRNDIRNYSEITKNQFETFYKKFKNEDINFKINENDINVKYYIWTVFLAELNKE